MNKIIRLSSVVLWVLVAALISMVVSLFIAWYQDGGALAYSANNGFNAEVGLQIVGNWSQLAEELQAQGFNASVLLGSVQLLPYLLINWILIRLFSLYRRGIIFEVANIRCFGYLGWILIAAFFINLLYPLLFCAVFGYLYPAIKLTAFIGVGGDELLLLFSGLILIVIAQVMAVGAATKREQELTI